MRVVTVARKPLSEGTVASNVLKHGCGAINIDGTRISTSDNLDGGAYAKAGTDRSEGYEGWRYKRLGDAGGYEQPEGRWPANLILVHRPGCQRAGTKKVQGSNPSYVTEGMGGTRNLYGNGLGPRPANQNIGYADEDGTETVTSWDCTPDCPVAALDAETGLRTTGAMPTGITAGAVGRERTYGIAKGYTTIGYGASSGVVSRYFKQVGGAGQCE